MSKNVGKTLKITNNRFENKAVMNYYFQLIF